MKKVATLMIILATVSGMLAGCYSKTCGCKGSQCSAQYKS